MKRTNKEQQVRLKKFMIEYGIGQHLIASTLSKNGIPVSTDNPLQKVPSSRARMILNKEFLITF